ncbi:hypothetical protein [Streptosporangium carneum]|uniref:hypothetical protein n=1 Tax=Streptosporangium carneum TaxID=47481 RepID=UPI0022F322D2|nr:hypothetical protein [Streptosporangium carneum]
MTSVFSQQRLTYLGSLSAELSERGLAGRMVGGDDPVLWVWHPDSLRQTIVFATPAGDGWLFLWSPDGQENAEDFRRAADSIKRLLEDSAQPAEP